VIPPGLERIVEHAAAKRERRGPFGDGAVRLPAITELEANALDGLPWPGHRRTFIHGDAPTTSLLRFEAALEAAGLRPRGLYTQSLGRDVRDLPGEQRARRAERRAFAAALLAEPRVHERPPLRAWIEGACGAGQLGPDDGQLIDGALRVVARLTSPGASRLHVAAIDRVVLAAELFDGRPHALDADTRLERLTRSMLAACSGIDGESRPRAIWNASGVEIDASSSAALTLNLAPYGDGPLELALRAQLGRHVVITLGQLRDRPVRWPACDVFVCENPSVLRAVQRARGPHCAPLICGSGWPTDAVRELLEQLRRAGTTLHYHGDFDLAGVSIFRLLEREVGVQPWCYDVGAYGAALARCHDRDLPLVGSDRPASGDLERALLAGGREIPEELLIDDLIDSLSRVAAER